MFLKKGESFCIEIEYMLTLFGSLWLYIVDRRVKISRPLLRNVNVER